MLTELQRRKAELWALGLHGDPRAPGSRPGASSGSSPGDPRQMPGLNTAGLMQRVIHQAGAGPVAAASPFDGLPRRRGPVPTARPAPERYPEGSFQLAQSMQAATDAFNGKGVTRRDMLPAELRPPLGAAKPSQIPPSDRLTRSPDPRATRKEVAQRAMGQNLVLGKNELYRGAILEGAYLSGVTPQFLAAMAQAEALTRADGTWRADSEAGTTTAKGLMQFTEGTWRDEAKRRGAYLNKAAGERGLLNANGTIKDDRRLLALRMDPQLSIIAARQMASRALAELRAAGLVPSDVTEAEAAKLAYLAHHEGLGGAKQLLKGDLSGVTELKWRNNVTREDERQRYEAAAKLDSHKQAYLPHQRAYQAFMYDLTDRKIDVRQFTTPDKHGPSPRSMRELAKSGRQR